MSFRVRSALAVLVLFLPQLALAASADPSGTWLTQDGRARIRVEKCGPTRENVCGYVVWVPASSDAGQPRLDTRNPDARKRARPILGHQLIMGLRPNAEGRFEGQIYNSEDGKSYDVTVWTERAGILQVKGCLIAFLCSTQSWTLTSDPAPGQLVAATGAAGGPQPDPEWARAMPSAAAGTKREPAKARP